MTEHGAASCRFCSQPLQRKQTGRAPRYCGSRCRDRAREARTFALFGVARVRRSALDAPSRLPGNGDSPNPRNALADVSVPLDLIGHASHRFDAVPNLDRALLRTVLSTELQATVTPNSGD
jgi:hypothetical protein